MHNKLAFVSDAGNHQGKTESRVYLSQSNKLPENKQIIANTVGIHARQ